MALIPPFFLDCVVAIGVMGEKQKQWIGTGFIVGRPIDINADEKKYHTFIVTNKHVLKNHQHVILKFNSLNENSAIDYPVDLRPNNESISVGHPSDNVDIAVFNINPKVLKNDSAQFGFFKLDKDVIPISEMKNIGVSEGDGIFVMGFPMGIVAPEKKYAIVRAGTIARIRDAIEGQQSHFLIDASVFPGNSGGPVVIKPEVVSILGTKAINRAALIGIVKSYLLYKDVAISQQTGNPRVIFEENSGLALVETVDNIISTVDLCYDTKINITSKS